MRSSSATSFRQSRHNLTRSHSDSNTSLARTSYTSTPQVDTEQLPQPRQAAPLLWWTFFSLACTVAAFCHWVIYTCAAFLRYIWDWNTLFGILLASTLYTCMLDPISVTRPEDMPVLNIGPTAFEWQEVRRCRRNLESLQREYVALYNQIHPVQDAVEHLKTEIRTIMHTAQDATHSAVKQVIEIQQSGGALSEQQVTVIINDAMKMVQEDYVRLADSALKSAGATVVRSRTSKSYERNLAQTQWHNFALWNHTPNPEVILEPDIYPGNCWPFPGSRGHILVKLDEKIHPTAVTIQHLTRAASPPGEVTSAPKDFTVYGLTEETEEEGTFLGQFTYISEGLPIQTFPLTEGSGDTFNYIQLRVLSNWGNSAFTCVYRFRIHRDLSNRALQQPKDTESTGAK
ncbi:SUN domain-containing protein 3-like [Ambystoma mexicanum]|uniref:SUN domain-containing protein 3-like n=1 Tax=Ambystoma mexicanum TaxID=8296 RepID=UPI0037E81481